MLRLSFAALACLALFGVHAHGEMIRVTRVDDSTDRQSLRGAIIEANRRGGENTILLQPGQRPVFRLGQDYFGIDVSLLPSEAIIRDNNPPGHVGNRGVPPQELKDAVVEQGTLPK